jgi:hypothetical protein
MDGTNKKPSNSTTKNRSMYIIFLIFIKISTSKTTTTTTTSPSTYHLDGINSFAKYPAWQPCHNDTFEFEFKTNDYNSLIFYAQFNPYTYIQINLNNGYLRMKFRIHETDDPDGVYLENTYNRLNDDKWHHIIIRRLNELTKLLVDNEKSYTYKHKNIKDYNNNNNNNIEIDTANSLFVFGGLPNYIQTYDLSSSTVLFEKRFTGHIRNVRLLNCKLSYIHRISFIDHNGLKSLNEIDSCATNPCLNNGLCVVMDIGFFCDCSYINYDGKNCEKCKVYFF